MPRKQRFKPSRKLKLADTLIEPTPVLRGETTREALEAERAAATPPPYEGPAVIEDSAAST